MCIAFIKNGKDYICGYNLDMAFDGWDYKVYCTKDLFYVGIKIGSRIYKTHGVNSFGHFANLPYMNYYSRGVKKRDTKRKRIDLLVDAYLENSISFDDVFSSAKEENIVNLPNVSLHSLFGDANGNILVIEPGIGYQKIEDNYAIITNFPILKEVNDLDQAYYGYNRYLIGKEILENSSDNFSVMDAFKLLDATRQGEPWATRVSFVYSRNEHTVYYVFDGDFKKIHKHIFE